MPLAKCWLQIAVHDWVLESDINFIKKLTKLYFLSLSRDYKNKHFIYISEYIRLLNGK